MFSGPRSIVVVVTVKGFSFSSNTNIALFQTHRWLGTYCSCEERTLVSTSDTSPSTCLSCTKIANRFRNIHIQTQNVCLGVLSHTIFLTSTMDMTGLEQGLVDGLQTLFDLLLWFVFRTTRELSRNVVQLTNKHSPSPSTTLALPLALTLAITLAPAPSFTLQERDHRTLLLDMSETTPTHVLWDTCTHPLNITPSKWATLRPWQQ